MASGLPDLASVKAVCAAIAKPFNFMVGIPGKSFTVAELEAAGVRRISLAGSLYRAATSGLVAAAREVKDKGTFGYVDTSLRSPDSCGGKRVAPFCPKWSPLKYTTPTTGLSLVSISVIDT